MSDLLRITPSTFSFRRPARMIERHTVAYRRQWMLIVSGFFEPLFYLLSMRTGLGGLVGTVTVAGRDVRYDAFVAPALMAASSMNGAVFDSTGNVFHRLRFSRIYDAALATPMSAARIFFPFSSWRIRSHQWRPAYSGTRTTFIRRCEGGRAASSASSSAS